jgi:subtilisin family serine protease
MTEHSNRGPSLSRRGVLTTLAGAAGVALTGRNVTGVSVDEGRFVVDTASTPTDNWKDGVEVIHEIPQIDIAVVRGSEEALSGVRFEPDVKLEVEPPESHTPEEAPSKTDADPEFLAGGPGNPSALQWDKHSLGVDEVHDAGITGSDVTISIVDNGVDPYHPDIDYDMSRSNTIAESAKPIVEKPGGPIPPNDPPGDRERTSISEHGTHCAGIAAGTGDAFVLGNAPGATVISQNIATATGGAYGSDIALGVVLSADNGADVLNLSFGSYPNPPTVSTDLAGDMAERAAMYALDNGTLPVTSAGNSSVNLDTDGDVMSRYADVPGFMPVSATGSIGFSPESSLPKYPLENANSVEGGMDAPPEFPSFFTTYGAEALSVSAPGGNVGSIGKGYYYDLLYSAVPESAGAFGWKAGTSMAAPQVAGIAGLVAGQHPSATPGQIRQHIENTANQIRVDYDRPENIYRGLSTYFGPDGWLADPYESETYRGNGHADLQQSATKSIPFPGGINVAGKTVYPADPDNDGLYEDVNGDGVVDMDDVELLYQIALRNAVSPDADAFDFNGDGTFDMYDVQALIRRVES